MDPSLGRLFLEILALMVPLSLGAAAVLTRGRAPFRAARWATTTSVILALLVAVGSLAWPATTPVGPSGAWLLDAITDHVRLDGVTVVMLGLVSTMGLVIARYSRAYLHGEPGRPRYARALLATLATVTTLVIAEHLLVIALAWMGSSFALHQLLTHYRERPGAIVAAHKKFLVSRFADVHVLTAIGLLGLAAGGVELETVHAWARSVDDFPPLVELAAVLLVLGVSLKTAQLPFHGWLTQVMEAPTPVSALLHAGVVNIGGVVLIRLAPVMMGSEIAMIVLVVIGTATAVISGLVMTARPSIKTSLAWSTSAQMGFMLVECGLGAWHLALLHLVVHSFYKAHAFLGSGSTVDQWRVRALVPSRRAGPTHVVGAVVIVGAGLVGLSTVAEPIAAALEHDPTLVPMGALLGLSLVPTLARALAAGPAVLVRVGGLALVTVGMFLGWHLAFGALVASPTELAWGTWGAVLGVLTLQLAVQAWLEARPAGRLARALRPHLLAGLYFDALFTRLVFWLWPPRRPHAAPASIEPRLLGGPQEQRA